MINNIDTVWFNGMFAIYLLFKLFAPFVSFPPPIEFYLADVLALPIIIGVTEDTMRFLYGHHYRLTRRMLMLTFLFIALMFEWVFPRLGFEQVGDPFDVVAYAVGLLWMLWIKKTASLKAVE